MYQPEYLYRLARSGAKDDRQALAQAVISFMHEDLKPNEQNIAEEILLRLLKEAAHDIRLGLAEQLAREPNCPKALLDYLVYENPLEVSAPVLQYSEALNDDYLIQVARHFQKTEYWQILARRFHVSENLSRFLVGTDDIDVQRILLKNRGAQLGQTSMGILAETAITVPEMQQPLLSRPEVTPELAAKLYWHVSAELRNQITTQFDISQQQIDVLLDQAVKQRLAEKEIIFAITDDMVQQAEALKEDNAITSHQLLEALKKDDVPFFVCLWASLLTIDPEFITKKLQENFAVSMAIMCRAANITKRDYNVLFLLWRRKKKYIKGDSMELSTALEYFNALTMEDALDIMGEWLAESGKVQTVH